MSGLAALAIASWCSGLRSEPSRVFSGAPILIQASHSSSSSHAERRALGDELGRGGLRPDGLEGPEIHPTEAELDDRDRLPPPDRPDDLLDERPRLRAADDEHLPAGLHVDAPVDEERCVVRDSRVSHSSPLLY